MPFDMDASGVESPGQILGGIQPGTYHVIVKDVDEDSDEAQEKQQIRIDFELLNGTVPGQTGKTHRDYFSRKGKGFERVKALAMTLGLLRPGERKQVSFKDAIGRQLIVCWETHEYQGKKNVQIPWAGFWSVDDPSQAGIPMDKEMLAAAKGGAAPVVGTPAQATKATAKAGAMDWSDV